MTAHRIEWDRRLREALAACHGEFLVEAMVIEMGLYGPEKSPVFSDSDLHFMQALTVEFEFDSGIVLQVNCVQDDDEFALWPKLVSNSERLSRSSEMGTLFRFRSMPEIQKGCIQKIEIETDKRGNIQVARLCFASNEVVLRAGEVYENADGSLTIADRDESVIIFMNRSDYNSTVFNVPAYRVR